MSCILEDDSLLDFITIFLGEIDRIPYHYTYEQGVPVIKDHLIARYGDACLAQAMHYLFDLIENDQNNLGHGDIGDRYIAHAFKLQC